MRWGMDEMGWGWGWNERWDGKWDFMEWDKILWGGL